MAISFRSASSSVQAGTTSVLFRQPDTVEAGDALFWFTTSKYPPNKPASPTGYSETLAVTGGAGAAGLDSGNVTAAIFERIGDGSEDALTEAISVSGGNSNTTRSVGFGRSAGSGWLIARTSGAQSSAANTWNVTSADSIALAAGDYVIVGIHKNSDAGSTLSSDALSASGITFGTMEALHGASGTVGTTQGDDCAMRIVGFPVTAGSGTVALTMTFAQSAAATTAGVVTFIRLREDVSGASHATTGALTAQAATLAAVSAHQHAATGTLSAQAADVAGSAAHLSVHATSGELTAQAATVAGEAAHQHAATGVLAAQAATAEGTAAHLTLHTSSGALEAQAATASGTAAHEHATTGDLAAAAATVDGTASHLASHEATGDLAAQAASVAGSAAHEHAATGALDAGSAEVAGTAEVTADGTFSATGAIVAQAATVDGEAAHLTLHSTTGALAASAASVAGSAVHNSTHEATGALVAGAASISGSARGPAQIVIPGGSGEVIRPRPKRGHREIEEVALLITAFLHVMDQQT